MSDPLRASDEAAAAVAKTQNRVSLGGMVDKIAAEYSFTMDRAVESLNMPPHESLAVLTLCVLVMQNGFTVIGKSAPADAANFDHDLGARFAREDAIRQLWPLEGYALRERLAAGRERAAVSEGPLPVDWPASDEEARA